MSRLTPLHAHHMLLGATMTPYASHMLPLTFQKQTIIQQIKQTRTHAAIFDVSHMTQITFRDKKVPKCITAPKVEDGNAKLTVLTNDNGGIIDDAIVSVCGDRYMFVGNGARAKEDIDFFRSHQVEIDIHDRALVAIQGPTASQALETFLGYSLSNLKFMQTATIAMSENKVPVWVMRGGYTGEDGFELSIPAEHAVEIVASLLRQAGVEMAGLAARDTLRLEAGLCLYGNDIDECTTPVEAGLTWTICKDRRKALDYPGAHKIREQLRDNPWKKRVGLLINGAPARAGCLIRDLSSPASEIGRVTSGGPSPTLHNAHIAMGYTTYAHSKIGSHVQVEVRNRLWPAQVVGLPFVPHRYVH